MTARLLELGLKKSSVGGKTLLSGFNSNLSLYNLTSLLDDFRSENSAKIQFSTILNLKEHWKVELLNYFLNNDNFEL